MAVYVKALHPMILDEWRAQIDALPNRKKSKWSAIMKNSQGEFRKYRYNQGYFEVKLNGATGKLYGVTEFPKDGWAPVIPLRGCATFQQLERAYGAEHAQTYIDGLHGTHIMGRIEELTEEENLSATGLLVQQLQAVQLIAESHTGQHHRNTTISIPTAAGQPVRG
jgi:hypothetical protein